MGQLSQKWCENYSRHGNLIGAIDLKTSLPYWSQMVVLIHAVEIKHGLKSLKNRVFFPAN